MQIEKRTPSAPSQRPIRRRPARSRRRQSAKRSRLKYGNLFSLIVGAIALGWIVTLPFRSKRPSTSPVLEGQGQPPALSLPANQTVANSPSDRDRSTFAYNVKIHPSQVYSQELQTIVNELVALAERKKLPTEALSITLIDVSSSNTHTFAGYNNQTPRFPASVAKLFWMVAFYAAVEKGKIQNEPEFYSDLEQMMQVSNNDAASRILDAITDTQSGDDLKGEALRTWVQKRQRIDTFFQAADYKDIKLSTKNYPIYYLNQDRPIGRDLQLWRSTSHPVRNQVTTDQAARILYEIYTRQAISPEASRKMAYLLTRDLNPKAWKDDPSNPIKGFLGEYLPPNIYFGSKVGYTTGSRTEAAFVRTLDDRAIYILAVFGDDPAYAKDEQIFPQMSRHVFNRLKARGPK